MAAELEKLAQEVRERARLRSNPDYETGSRLIENFADSLLQAGLIPPDLSSSEALATEGETVLFESTDRVGFVAKRLRKQAGKSLREVARSAGISAIQLSRVERGVSSPTEEKIRGLAGALGVSISTLFGEQPVNPDAPVTPQIQQPPHE